MRILPVAAATALVFAIGASPALAQNAPSATPPDAGGLAEQAGDNITVGVGGAYLPDYEGSNDYRFTPVPGAVGAIHGFNFTLAGNRLSVDVIPDHSSSGIDFQFGPIGVLNFNRSSTKSIDDIRIRRLGEVKTAIELGGYVGIGKTGVITSPYDRLSVSVSYRHDVNNAHDSGIIQPSINYLTPLSRKAAVGLFVSGEHVESGYARTYYSVGLLQAFNSGLTTFNARGGWKNYTLGALATVSLTGDLLHGFKVVGGGTYSRLLNDFADSPVTRVAGRRDQFLGVLGLAYTF